MTFQTKYRGYLIRRSIGQSFSRVCDKKIFSCLGLDWHNHVVHNPDLLRPTDIMISKSNPIKAKFRLGCQTIYKMKDVAKMMVEAQVEQMDKNLNYN